MIVNQYQDHGPPRIDGFDAIQARKIVNCQICRTQIHTRPIIKRLGFNFGTICRACEEIFSEEDLQLTANMLKAYGGYFGKYRNLKMSVFRVIEALSRQQFTVRDGSDKVAYDVKILHSALMFGITPSQLRSGIKLAD